MTPEALKIREYILNSAISDSAKNEILPLLGVIETPGIKERILKILEIEGKAAELEEKFLNFDIDNPQGNTQQQVPEMASAQQAPVAIPVQNPAPVAPVQTIPLNTPMSVPQAPTESPMMQSTTQNIGIPASAQTGYDDQAIKQLEDRLSQLQQK
jgi:hypothetical protein